MSLRDANLGPKQLLAERLNERNSPSPAADGSRSKLGGVSEFCLEKLERDWRREVCGWLAEGSSEGQTEVYSCAAMEFGNSNRTA